MTRGSAMVLICALLAACGGNGEVPEATSQGTPGPTELALASDTSKPTVMLTSPSPFAAGLTGTIVATANARDDLGVESVIFEVDGAPVGDPDTSAPYGVSIDTALYPAGQHVIRARSRDAAGNLSGWSGVTVEIGGIRRVPVGFTIRQTWVGGLVKAAAFAQLPGGRLLVAQQGGALRVVKGGALLQTPFVQLAVDSTGERGLIGVTPYPGFATNGFVYVHYTIPSGGVHNRISRFTADPVAGGDVAVPGSEVVLVDLPPLEATNHNVGAIHFGLDGKLYVGVGDNSRSETAQDLAQPLGKSRFQFRYEPGAV